MHEVRSALPIVLDALKSDTCLGLELITGSIARGFNLLQQRESSSARFPSSISRNRSLVM
jgi:hypothetical protein